MFLEVLQYSQENTCGGVSLKFLAACNFIRKETLVEVFFFKFCEIFKNTYFEELKELEGLEEYLACLFRINESGFSLKAFLEP